jgi:hypothetical protein
VIGNRDVSKCPKKNKIPKKGGYQNGKEFSKFSILPNYESHNFVGS